MRESAELEEEGAAQTAGAEEKDIAPVLEEHVSAFAKRGTFGPRLLASSAVRHKP